MIGLVVDVDPVAAIRVAVGVVRAGGSVDSGPGRTSRSPFRIGSGCDFRGGIRTRIALGSLAYAIFPPIREFSGFERGR